MGREEVAGRSATRAHTTQEKHATETRAKNKRIKQQQTNKIQDARKIATNMRQLHMQQKPCKQSSGTNPQMKKQTNKLKNESIVTKANQYQ